ncbi:TIGR01459 family HAD-type hydrolase [Methyloceanibacter methanicus]|uniref:TIGR01459 family HAD-type hydrolase n=1 Tax=Methyloceanibacter methanicus TaxID=1774968 RepID=UPI000AC1ED31|nr:TIGR01459 family HAD-type hydrolase [Methyloceanibacter methanicus]
MEASLQIPVIESIREIGGVRRVWFVDIWGVMHNGRDAFPDASAATRAFRDTGGVVVLLSNSPRPSPDLQEQLRLIGVPDDAYDATVSSGDLTRHELAKHKGARVFHLGPDRDRPIFENAEVTLTGPEDAELIVCSGLFDDEVETPEDYVELLSSLAARGVPMICANPDHKVERGHQLLYCAGALAAAYEGLGGNAVYAGKPHRPVYELAFETAARIAARAAKPSRSPTCSPLAMVPRPTSSVQACSACRPCLSQAAACAGRECRAPGRRALGGSLCRGAQPPDCRHARASLVAVPAVPAGPC